MDHRSMSLACILALMLQGGFWGKAMADDVVGKIGGVELKTSKAKQILEEQNPQARTQLAASPANLDRFVRSILVREALAAEARAKGWDRRPEVLRAIERAAEEVLISAYVGSLAQPPADYPRDQDIKAFYDANQGRFFAPRQVHFAHIYLSTPPGADPNKVEEIRKKAEVLSERVRVGSDFAALAKQNSEDRTSADQGGDMGWHAEIRLAPYIRETLNTLSKNQVSDPVGGPQIGWHVLKLLDVRPAALQSLAAVRDAVTAELRARKLRENGDKYVEELVRRTPPLVDEIELTRLRESVR